MDYSPSCLPEMRDVQIDDLVDYHVKEALVEIAKVIGDCKHGHHQALKNVGSAMILTCRISRLSMTEQWVLRQRLLDAQWDEVEFELVGQTALDVALIEHKFAQPPRTLVIAFENPAA